MEKGINSLLFLYYDASIEIIYGTMNSSETTTFPFSKDFTYFMLGCYNSMGTLTCFAITSTSWFQHTWTINSSTSSTGGIQVCKSGNSILIKKTDSYNYYYPSKKTFWKYRCQL